MPRFLLPHRTATPKGRTVKLLLAGILTLWATLVVSCMTTTSRAIVAPPQIAGANFVGSDSCEACHGMIVDRFATATHAKLVVDGIETVDAGCEACHGAGSLHIESGGSAHAILNPDRSPETCYQCHLDMRAQFSLPYVHNVDDGHVTCTDCHDPHEGSARAGGGTLLASVNDVCLECHTAQRGPFVFEHEAMRDGCTTCHNPHGSVNPKMLLTSNANLCQSCHAQEHTPSGAILIGGRNHNGFLSRGTCWSAGCHEAVHGSHVLSSLRF